MGTGGKPDRQVGSCFSELNAVHLIAKGKKLARDTLSVPSPLQGAGQWENK